MDLDLTKIIGSHHASHVDIAARFWQPADLQEFTSVREFQKPNRTDPRVAPSGSPA